MITSSSRKEEKNRRSLPIQWCSSILTLGSLCIRICAAPLFILRFWIMAPLRPTTRPAWSRDVRIQRKTQRAFILQAMTRRDGLFSNLAMFYEHLNCKVLGLRTLNIRLMYQLQHRKKRRIEQTNMQIFFPRINSPLKPFQRLQKLDEVTQL